MRKGAFTLIELLVVIAIIALLAALLFPVFTSAKRAAKQSSCVSNMKQIGTAIVLYEADSDDLFPYAVDAEDKWAPDVWSGFPDWQLQIATMPLLNDALQPYCKSKDIFHCPADSGSQVLDDTFPHAFPAPVSVWNTYGSSYFYRTELAFRSMSQTSLRDPSATGLGCDGSGHWHRGVRALEPTDDPGDLPNLTRDFRYNALFADIHVKGLSFASLDGTWQQPL